MTVHRFGPFRFDSAQRLLFRNSELIPLVPKAADTLHALLEHRGKVVGKADLMKAVWPDCVVEDIGLARNVSILRKALGDDSEIYIETIPKRGYRFAAESAEAVQPLPTPRPRQSRRPTWAAAIAGLLVVIGIVYWQFYRPSRYLPNGRGLATLAVVPFECLSPDLERDAFAQGFTETLSAEISKLNSVQVMSPGTIERYRRLHIPTPFMARILGLDVMVEGTAQRFGQTVRISVRLTDVHSGRLIWAESYDAGAADLGQLEASVSHRISEQIDTRLSPHRAAR